VRSVLSVFLATGVLVAGMVIVVLSQQDHIPGAALSTRSSVSVPQPTRSAQLTVDSGCHPASGSERLAAVPPAVTRRVGTAWERIERWLAVHAPMTAATLGGPATLKGISFVQQDIGVPLPVDLMASLLRHGDVGAGYRARFTLPPSYDLLWTREVVQYSRAMCESLAVRGDAAVGSWWHGQFVPVATGPQGWLFYDQRGGAARLGQQDPRKGGSFDHVPASLTELLEQTADLLEGKRPAVNDSRPSVTADGRLLWETARRR
jgi:hypothetical protein